MESPLSWRPSRLMVLGLMITTVTGTLAFAMAQSIRTIAVTPQGSFWLPGTSFAFLPTPASVGSTESLETMVVRTVRGLVFFGILAVYYLVLTVSGTGVLLFGIGTFRGILLLSREDIEKAVRSLRWATARTRQGLGNPWVQFVIVVVAGIGLLSASSFRTVVLETIFVLLIIVFGVVLLGGATLAVLGYPSGLADVFLVPPLLLMTLFLPPITAGLLAPSIRPHVERLSSALSIWILSNLLSIGGIDRLLSRTFQFEGIEYVLMWTALLLVLGWLAGTLVVGTRRFSHSDTYRR